MACTIVGNACKWARRDCTNSVGNLYGLAAGEAANGIGVDADGNHHYCAKVWTDNNDDLSDTNSDGYDDTVTPVQESATGAARFPASGFCNQKGTCDQFTAAENDTGRDASFRYEYHIARYFKELWGACDAKKDQIAVGVETYLAGRIMAPGIAWLSGYVGLANPNGYRTKVEFSANGNWGYPSTYTDIDGTHLITLAGPFQEYDSNDPSAGGAGNITANVTDFTATRDPIDIASSFVQDEMERIGFAVERDTGALSGYSHAASSVAIESQTVVLAAFNAFLTTLQSRPMGTFQRGESGADWILKLSPLRQELKAHIFLSDRTVVSVADQGSDVYRITLANGEHSYSSINTGDPGDPSDSFDDIVTWHGGGSWPIAPEQRQEITNFYEDPKTTGSRLRGAWRGDAVKITVSGVEKHYVITDVHPHGGSEAAGWDGDTPEDFYCVGQNYTTFGKKQDTVDVWDPSGTVASLSADDTIGFYKMSMVALPDYTVEYSDDGGETWAAIPSESVTYNNNGEVHGTDEWLVSLASTVYFRFVDVRLMDHRGILSASTYNKTAAAVESLVWVASQMTSGEEGSFTYHSEASKQWGYSVDPGNECGQVHYENPATSDSGSGSTGNSFIIQGSALENQFEAEVSLQITSQSLGPPPAIARLPRGTTLDRVLVEVTGSGLTRAKDHSEFAILSDCETTVPTVTDPTDTSITDVSYVVIGFTSATDFEILGEIPGASNGIKVLDSDSSPELLDIFQTMVDNASTGLYAYGYGIVYSPVGLSFTGDVEGFLPGEGPTRSRTVCPPSVCEGTTYQEYYTTDKTELHWTGLTMGNVSLKCNFPQWFKDLQLTQPRWPSFKALT